MNLNNLKVIHEGYSLKLLHKFEKIFIGTLKKYTGSDYTI